MPIHTDLPGAAVHLSKRVHAASRRRVACVARNTAGHLTRLVLVVFAAAVVLAGFTAPAIAAAAEPEPPVSADPASGVVGWPGASYSGHKIEPTQTKAQSKLWFNDGSWWGAHYTSGAGWQVKKWDRATHTWSGASTVIDDRFNTLVDTLWVGDKLYIASHVLIESTNENPTGSQANQQARLYRLSYSNGQYTLDPGFPTVIGNYSTESLTIDRDSQGRIWAAWTQTSSSGGWHSVVYTNVSTSSGGSWGTPFVVPVADPVASADDIAAVVAFQGKVGIMWSDQKDGRIVWATHADTDAPDTGWSTQNVLSGTNLADDHLNLKSLQDGENGYIVGVSKSGLTGGNNSQLYLHVYRMSTQTFTTVPVASTSDCATRPQVLVDSTENQVHVAYTATSSTISGCPYSGVSGSIWLKSSPLESPGFAPGRGMLIMEDPGSATINDVATTKQPVDSTTGLLWVASQRSPERYWTADLAIPAQAPTASFTATPTSGQAHLAVSFTDTSTGSPASWSWDFGDGNTSHAQSPTHTFVNPGTYTVVLTASNVKGSHTASTTITVDPAPHVDGTVSYVGGATTANGGSTLITIDSSGVAAVGDQLIATVMARGNPTITPPPGWTEVENTLQGTTARLVTFTTRLAAAPPSSYTFTLSKTQPATATLLTYRGVDAGAPIAASADYSSTTSTTTLNAPSVDAMAGQELVTLVATSVLTSITPPPMMTERADVNTGDTRYKASLEAADHTISASGPTGIRTATAATSAPTLSHTVALRPQIATMPDASFTHSTSIGSLLASFTDTSDGHPTTWSWDFGDGTTSTLQSPTHVYEAPGTYAVTLTSSNTSGSDSTTASVTLVAAPLASFTTSTVSGVAPLAVTFADTSSNDPTDWAWDFGDGTTSTLQSPAHTYDTPGSYTVSLTVSNAAGSDSESVTITVEADPPETFIEIEYIDGTTGSNGGATTISVDGIDGAVAGDQLIATVVARGNPAISPPSGWTEVNNTLLGTTARQVTFTTRLTGPSAPSYTFTLSKSQPATIILLAYRGTMETEPVAEAADAMSATISRDLAAPSVEAATGQRLITLVSTSNLTTINPPTGLTERLEANTGDTAFRATLEAADTLVTSSGTTGILTASSGLASTTIAHTLLLNPAEGSATDPGDADPDPEPGDPSVVTLVGTSSVSAATGSTITVQVPSGAGPGHLLVASLLVRGSPAVTAPTGWSLVEDTAQGTTARLVTFAKVAGAGEVPPVFTLSKSQPYVASIAAYDNGRVAVSAGSSSEVTTTAVVTPSLDAPSGGVLLSLGGVVVNTTFTPDTGLTELVDLATPAAATYKATLTLAESSVAEGPTSTHTLTPGSPSKWITQSILLVPVL